MNRIIFSITDKCNLSCRHCYEKKRKTNGNSELDILQIAKWINDISPKKVGISGGEPFCDRNKLYKFINALDDDIIINIASNGILLTKEDIKFLKSNDIMLQLSIDGDEDIHDYIRGIGTYNKLLNNIIELQTNEVTPKLVYTINRINYSNIESVFKLCKKLNLEYLYFERYIPSNNSFELSLDRNILKQSYNQILELSKIYQIKVHVNDPLYLAHQLELINGEKNKLINIIEQMKVDVGCSMCKTSIYVDSYGEIFPCSFIDFSIGNIKDSTIYELNACFEKMNFQNQKEKSECVVCEYKNICGGCKAVPYSIEGNWKGNNKLCWIYTRKD